MQMAFVKAPTDNWLANIEHNGNYMFKNMTENNRKRSREDDVCEFMPLSKRINNLHINNNLASTSAQVQETIQLNQINANADNGISSSNSPDSERTPSYDPGVGSSQSNYYYDNKLLFELHLERIQRTGEQFPF